MKIYRTQHFGFFTPWSRTFWDPHSQPLGLYFATVAPFWLGSTIWLALAGLLAGSHLLSRYLFAGSRSRSSLADDDGTAAPTRDEMADGTDQPRDEIAAGLFARRHLFRRRLLTRSRLRSPLSDENGASHLRDEIVFCCAILQTLFVLRFFGPPTSWTYYPYIVVMGVAAACMMNSVTARVTMLLVFVAFVALDASLVAASSQWKTYAPSASTAGLWADAADRAEWSTVTRLISEPAASPPRAASSAGRALRRDEFAGIVTNEVSDSEPSPPPDLAMRTAVERPRVVALGVAGAASILFPEFEKPIGAYLVRDEATPAEVALTIERIKAAEFVVRPAAVSIGDPIYAWPEMTRAFDSFEVIWKGQTFQVLRHR